jgi:hypothetical protein
VSEDGNIPFIADCEGDCWIHRASPQRTTKMAKTSKRSALEFFRTAREWLTAANELLRVQGGKPDAVYGWRHPIYFCYLQSIELALKAFWRSHNSEVEYGHPVTELYEKCREKGLIIDADDRTSIGNIVRMLDAGNEDAGFRYFVNTDHVLGTLEWTQEVATRLLQVVQAHVAETVECGPPNPRVVAFRGFMSKPVKQPVKK